MLADSCLGEFGAELKLSFPDATGVDHDAGTADGSTSDGSAPDSLAADDFAAGG
jgi:hypothetical protein